MYNKQLKRFFKKYTNVISGEIIEFIAGRNDKCILSFPRALFAHLSFIQTAEVDSYDDAKNNNMDKYDLMFFFLSFCYECIQISSPMFILA